MVSSSIRPTAWLQNSKKWRTVREIDAIKSHRDCLRSGYRTIVSARHGLLIITVITPLPTKPSDKKCQNWLANAAITDMQTRQRDVAALDAKYTKELADKAKNDALRDDAAAGRRRLHISKLSVSVKPPPPPAWIMQPPTGRHRWTGLFHPQREADHYAKTTEGTWSILMSSADRVAHIGRATHAIIVSNTHALPAEYKCLK